jgi:predicted nucleic acid-binding protein
VKYVDASALLRILFAEPGLRVPLAGNDAVVSSEIIEIEMCRAVDRERLVGNLDDRETAVKRKELEEMLRMLDLVPVGRGVVDLAREPFSVNVRALDAIHVATAQLLARALADDDAAESLTFWTHDERQATAALSRGIEVQGTEHDAA